MPVGQTCAAFVFLLPHCNDVIKYYCSQAPIIIVSIICCCNSVCYELQARGVHNTGIPMGLMGPMGFPWECDLLS